MTLIRPGRKLIRLREAPAWAAGTDNSGPRDAQLLPVAAGHPQKLRPEPHLPLKLRISLTSASTTSGFFFRSG